MHHGIFFNVDAAIDKSFWRSTAARCCHPLGNCATPRYAGGSCVGVRLVVKGVCRIVGCCGVRVLLGCMCSCSEGSFSLSVPNISYSSRIVSCVRCLVRMWSCLGVSGPKRSYSSSVISCLSCDWMLVWCEVGVVCRGSGLESGGGNGGGGSIGRGGW